MKVLCRLLTTFAFLFFIGLAQSSVAQIVEYRDAQSPRLIVFVHGIIGDSSTWKNPDAELDWPSMIVADSSFLNFDVVGYNYPSSLVSQAFSIDGLSQRLRIELSQWIGAKDYEDIVFVSHSMGGLVTRKMLLNDGGKIRDDTRLLLTFSTPMAGSNLANILYSFRRSSLIKNMKISHRSDTEGFLAAMRKEWREKRMARKISTYCAYETKPIIALKAVDPASSELLCDSGFVEIPRNHIQMVKPRSTNDYPYIVLKDWLSQEFEDVQSRSVEVAPSVLIANCSVGTAGENVDTAIENALYDVGADFGHSKLLPKNWQRKYDPKNVVWHSQPTSIVVHLSCFRDKERNEAGYVERTQDFIRFSQAMSQLGVRIFVYSQAFSSDPKFMDRHVNRNLPEDYLNSNGIQTFKIVSPSRIKVDGTIEKLRLALAEFLSV
jgi:hypothetical protein